MAGSPPSITAATSASRSANAPRRWSGSGGAQGFDIDLSELFYKGERNDVVDYLSARGWQVHSRSRRDVFADYGRQFPELANPLQHSVSITAIRD